MKRSLLFFWFLMINGIIVFCQGKLTIYDRISLLNDTSEMYLRERLRSDSLELTYVIDNKRRCDYWFAFLSDSGTEILLTVTDCNDRLAGKKSLGSVITNASDQDKAMLVYFALTDIIKNPFTDISATSVPHALVNKEDLQSHEPGQHRSRYFFAPSSYNLEKGELYYNSLYFILHDVQYGITDRFSMGMGTTIFGFPFYLTPKVTFPVNDKSAFALGDMFIIGTYGARFTGNLVYLTYSSGNEHSHFTAGSGFLTIGGKEIENGYGAPVLNLSALGRISDHIYFITENYISFSNNSRTAFSYDPLTGNSISQNFEIKNTFMYNLVGFRFINKVKDVVCWQVGLSFIGINYGSVPPPYDNQYLWSIDGPVISDFYPVPVIGYARKFSTHY